MHSTKQTKIVYKQVHFYLSRSKYIIMLFTCLFITHNENRQCNHEPFYCIKYECCVLKNMETDKQTKIN